MKSLTLFLAAVALALVASEARACPYNQAVATYAAPVAVMQTPVVVSQVAVVPTYAVQTFAVQTYPQSFAVQSYGFQSYGYGNNFAVPANFRGQRQFVGGNVNQQRGVANFAVGGGGDGSVNQQRGVLNVKLGR